MAERMRGPQPSRAPRPDYLLFVAVAILLIIGLPVMASIGEARDAMGKAPTGIFGKHLARIGLGILAGIAGALIPIDAWRQSAKAFLTLSLLLLAFTVLPRFGIEIPGVHLAVNGAYRWIRVGSLVVMPGELFKPVFVIWLAHFLSRPEAHPETLRGLSYPVIIGGIALMIFGLQPAVGTGAGVLLTAVAVSYLGGAPAPRVRTVCVAGVLAVVLLVISSPLGAEVDQEKADPAPEIPAVGATQSSAGRIWAYLQANVREYVPPWRWEPRRLCYHARQSLIAMGFGGPFGQGLGNGRHSYGRLPESHTDYPLAAIGEECGLVGTSFVVLAWIIILKRGMRIAGDALRQYSFLLAAGLTLNLVVFAAMNAAVVTALAPVTGQGMPFVSYGGLGTMMNFFSVGVIDAVRRSRT
jgi:cell division protein FtsW